MSDKPRPSSLPSLEACPRWVPRPYSDKKDALDEAADEGTLVHAKMEQLASIPVAQWQESIETDASLGPALIPVVLECADQIRDLFGYGLPVITKTVLGLKEGEHYELRDAYNVHGDGIYCEAGVDPVVTKHGTGDVFEIAGHRAVYADYKSNRVVRDHRAQMIAYAVGLFRAIIHLEEVEVRIVAPRLIGEHEPMYFSRCDLEGMEAYLAGIVARHQDPFEPGCPGTQCVTCKGNGRCPYQAASLKDIPVQLESLIRPGVWTQMLAAVTPDMRGQRRQLVKWLCDYCEAVKEDDKVWAVQFPDADLPGFKKSVQAGRASLDRDRLSEANTALLSEFGLDPMTLLAYLVPDKTRLAEHVGLNRGVSADKAELEISKALAPYMKRGQDIVQFRALKKEKQAAAIGA